MKAKLLAWLLLTFTALPSWAGVAANALITNQTSVSYDHSGTPFILTKNLSVSISLVACQPALATNDNTYNYSTGINVFVSGTLTACANGPDSYSLTSTIASQTNNQNNASFVTGESQNITLGASIVWTSPDLKTLTFPFDQNENNSINGLEANDRVIINGESRTVQSLTDTEALSQIVLNNDLTTAAGMGTVVYEQKDFSITLNPGTIIDPTQALSVDIILTATNSSANPATQLASFSFEGGYPLVQKWIRNTSISLGNSNGSNPVSFDVNGSQATYYEAGIEAAPGDTLEYLVSVQNIGTGLLANSVLEELIPDADLSFLTIIDTSQAALLFDGTQWLWLTTADDGDRLTLTVNTTDALTELNVDLGQNVIPQTGGEIMPGGTWLFVYRARLP